MYCIPSEGEREQREIDPFVDLRSQIKRTERGPQGARSRWGGSFLHFGDSFGSVSSRRLNERYSAIFRKQSKAME